MRTVWFAEQDAFCQRVLAKHWPGVPVYPDVRALVADPGSNGCHPRAERRARRASAFGAAASGQPDQSGTPRDEEGVVPVPVPSVDVLAGGFPCQDLSYAGRGAGIDGERSGLWAEYARLIRDLRPRYVIVENVPALLSRGMGRVLGDLAAVGYDAEWDCIPASAVGAPHRRDRVWIVAYPGHGQERGRRPRDVSGPGHAWATEPDVGRVAHGIPDRVDRLSALGNALVPQIAQWIGERIVGREERLAPCR